MKPKGSMQFPQGGTLLIVCDKVRIRQEMDHMMEAAGLSIRCAMDADEMRAMIGQSVPDIVLLDLNLPGEDGISLCQWLRSVYPGIGIVMLTARVMSSERAQGYLAGVDIYLTKPTRAEELLAVLRNLLLRLRSKNDGQQTSSSIWVLYMTEMLLESPQQDQLRLNLNETMILKCLSESLGVVAYQSLIESIAHQSGHNALEKTTLEVIMSRLRTKLANLSPSSLEIKTVHKIGFQLTCPLAVISKTKKPLRITSH